MLRELDRYEAEVRGEYVNAVTVAFHHVKSYLKEVTESGRAWALETALEYLANEFEAKEIEEIAENIMILLLC